jgi:hypothetical protein
MPDEMRLHMRKFPDSRPKRNEIGVGFGFLRRDACCSIAVFELMDLEAQLALERDRKSQRKMAMGQLEVGLSNGKSAPTKNAEQKTDRAGFRRKKLGLGRLGRRLCPVAGRVVLHDAA